MVSLLIGAIALGAFWTSTLGHPKLIDWPLRAFAVALALVVAGSLL